MTKISFVAVDRIAGEREIADQFRKVFQNLYTSAASEQCMGDIQNKLRLLLLSEKSNTEGEKVTPKVVQQAVTKVKKFVMDISQGFSSDALLMPRTFFSSCLPSPSRTVSVPRQEEGSTGKYQHEVKGVPEGAARGNPSTECWYFTVLPDSSQGTGITQFIMLLLLLYRLEKATLVGAELVLENTIERMVSTVRVIIQYASFRN